MKKIICLVLALCMTACLFAGCGSDSSKDAESTASVAESKGTLTMGTNATFPPMNSSMITARLPVSTPKSQRQLPTSSV